MHRHFTHREVLLDAIQRTGGRLYTPALKGDSLADLASQSWLTAGEEERNPLIELAGQFGEATGLHKGLRSAIGKPKTMKELHDTTECHERGSILVAAVFDAFFTVYIQRTANHFRIYRSNGGRDREDLPAPLADALCEEATRTATQFFRTCVRALDYLPPVDVTFGDFLRAVMTSEIDFDPVDQEGIRDAWMQAFRRREILPDDAPFFSEHALCWPARGDDLEVKNLPFGGPLGLSYQERQQTAKALQGLHRRGRQQAVAQSGPRAWNTGFRPSIRCTGWTCSGSTRWDLVVEVVQTAPATPTTFPMRGGTTMIISTHGTGGGGSRDDMFLRYVISKPLGGREGKARAQRQTGVPRTAWASRPAATAGQLRVNFALVHGGA